MGDAMKIIIVEDEIRIREGLRNLLQKISQNNEVIGEAENGAVGLDLILRLNPDVVITDIKMPIMDGLDMLTVAYQHNCKFKAIVLSAYSEFSYAQQAIKLGVCEYLLKPIVVNDLTRSLKNIETQYEQERINNPISMGNLENIFKSIIFGGLIIDDDLEKYVQKKYGIENLQPCVEVLINLGDKFVVNYHKTKQNFISMLKQRDEIGYRIFEVPKERMLLVIIYGRNDYLQLERWFQNQILIGSKNEICKSYGWVVTAGFRHLKESYHNLLQYMDWSISLGDDVIISYPKIKQVQTIPCIYPIEIENKIKIVLCTSDGDKVSDLIGKFVLYFKDGKVYSPNEIKESFIRFLWAIINVAKEIDMIDYLNLEQQKIMEKVMSARTYGELIDVTNELRSDLILDNKEETISTNITIKRAKRLIHEFYQTGITLDEIADKLNITPEYLGTQFHKETGVNFSSYIKNYRINKAKELLIGTHLKQYEISEKIGYNDAKYFSRVFRESTGQLPAEYRKSYK